MTDNNWPPDLVRRHDVERGRRDAEVDFAKFLEEVLETLKIADNHLHPDFPDPIAAGLNLSHAIGLIGRKLEKLRG